METQVTTSWQDLLELAQNGRAQEIAGLVEDEAGPVFALLKGYAIYTEKPEEAKDLFAQARRSTDLELSQQAAIFEARCYEYLGQYGEGKILIRSVLPDLIPRLRPHGLFVLSVLQRENPTRALTTLSEINEADIPPGLHGRILNWRAKLYADEKKYDEALIDYAGAAIYFEEVSDLSGVAHAHNNRAGVFRRQKQFAEAHKEVDQAIALLPANDPFMANFLDHKAQIFVAERRYKEAERLAVKAVALVHGTDRRGVLCENLCTLALAYAGLKNYPPAAAALASAKGLASDLGSTELEFIVAQALRDAAEIVLKDAELEMAELALKLTEGSYRPAAKMVGLTHVGLIKLLKRNGRYRKLRQKNPTSRAVN